LVAGHCAGLVAEEHACRWLESLDELPAIQARVALFPVVAHRTEDPWTAWRGVAPELLLPLLAGTLGTWAARRRLRQTPCHCGIKYAVLPAHFLRAWRRALAGSPFGSESVVDRWICLGIQVSARCIGNLSRPRLWTQEAIRVARHGSWARPLDRLGTRVVAAQGVRRPPALRVVHWSTY
jgi:hypothetical protein